MNLHYVGGFASVSGRALCWYRWRSVGGDNHTLRDAWHSARARPRSAEISARRIRASRQTRPDKKTQSKPIKDSESIAAALASHKPSTFPSPPGAWSLGLRNGRSLAV